MHRLVVSVGGTETVFRTEMEQGEFRCSVDNVNMGNERVIGFMDDEGAFVYVNPANVSYMRFEGWDDRR